MAISMKSSKQSSRFSAGLGNQRMSANSPPSELHLPPISEGKVMTSNSLTGTSKSKHSRYKSLGLQGFKSLNPFETPGDDFIFEFEEAQEQERSYKIERNKRLHIWEKNRPIREGRLRSMCGADLEPTSISINPRIRTLITETGPQVSLPTDKARNKQTRHELIQKKRQLFLMQMMINTKSTEIQKLEHYSQCHEDGLSYSQKMLERDGQAFAKFVDKCREEVKNATDKVDMKMKKKQVKISEQQRLNQLKTQELSVINKNLDGLNEALKYKFFIEKAGRKGVKKKTEQEEEDEIKERRSSTRRSKNLKIGGEGGISIPPHIQDIIEDQEDEMDIGFDNPDQLADVFTGLEERNLELIQSTQEIEHGIEQVKHHMKDLEEKFSKQLTTVNKKRENMEKMILEEREKVNSIKQVFDKQVSNEAEEKIIKTLEDKIKKIFLSGKHLQIRNNPLQMLTQIEQRINKHLKWMRDYQDKGEDHQVKIEKKQKEIDRMNRAARREEKMQLDQQRQEEKLREKTQKKARQAMMSKQKGKREAFRSQPPQVKKDEVEQVETDEDERDYRKYIINVQ